MPENAVPGKHEKQEKSALRRFWPAAVVGGGVAAVAAATLVITGVGDEPAPVAARSEMLPPSTPETTPVIPEATPEKKHRFKSQKKKAIATGSAAATHFWDGQTASGRPMSETTIASPFWPLGTKVKVTASGRSVVGTVDDFGPADFVRQSHPKKIIDLARPLYARLDPSMNGYLRVKWEIVKMGDGRRFRTSGPGEEYAR